jgi:hypothetical protein
VVDNPKALGERAATEKVTPGRMTRALFFAGALLVLVVGLSSSLPQIPRKLAEAARRSGEGLVEAERRIYGEHTMDAITEARRLIPREGAYYLADAGAEPGMTTWVRYLLAPRRCELLGTMERPGTLTEREGRPARLLPFVVVTSHGDTPVEVVASQRFFGGKVPFDPGLEDTRIPASIDGPPDGAVVSGPLEVRGWCQESGGRPCAQVRIWLDGVETEAAVERFPRPDVEHAVRGIGNADRAGYRATLRPDPARTRHRLNVYFLTADGRYRRLGPLRFESRP